ncbi:MAG: aminotransferase class IV [Chitinophagaceae bacterium]
MESFLNYNGKILLANELLISPSNRSFRYGDGFFETIKVKQGEILLKNFHEDRILKSLHTLKFTMPKLFSVYQIFSQIEQLVVKNKQQDLARVRLTFFRGDGGLYDAENYNPNYVIQSYQLTQTLTELNTNGLVMGFYKDGIKPVDSFCNIKNNSFLPYTMAALWAKENKLNDAIVLNSNNTIADTTIANIFIVKNNEIFTPKLEDACIAGVTRNFLIKNVPSIQQKSINEQDMLTADEVFVTNAIRGIQWVKQVANSTYALGSKTLECAKLLQQL